MLMLTLSMSLLMILLVLPLSSAACCCRRCCCCRMALTMRNTKANDDSNEHGPLADVDTGAVSSASAMTAHWSENRPLPSGAVIDATVATARDRNDGHEGHQQCHCRHCDIVRYRSRHAASASVSMSPSPPARLRRLCIDGGVCTDSLVH